MRAAFLAAAFAVPAKGIYRDEPQHLLGQWMLSEEGLVSKISAAEIFTRVQDYSMATLNYDEDTARKIEFTPRMIMSVGSGLEGREVISVQSPDKKTTRYTVQVAVPKARLLAAHKVVVDKRKIGRMEAKIGAFEEMASHPPQVTQKTLLSP
jgi:hypothetical protein